MPTKSQALRAYQTDERRMLQLYAQNIRAGHRFKRSVERYITDRLADLVIGGTLPNNGVVIDRLSMIERELPVLMRSELGTAYRNDILSTVAKRIDTIDATMRRIGLDAGVLGETATRYPVYIARTSIMADAISRGTERAGLRIIEEIAKFKTQLGEGVTMDALKQGLTQKAGIATQYAGTVANTELAALDRDLRKIQTVNAGLGYLRYTGPVDKTARDFCIRWAGQVETINFWENLENDTGPQPAASYCGGFNCRHRLLPWDPNWPD